MKNLPAKISAFLAVTVLLGGYCFVCPQGVKVAKAAESDHVHARCEDGVKSRDIAGPALLAAAHQVIAREPTYCPMSHGAGTAAAYEGVDNDHRSSRFHPLANSAAVGIDAPRYFVPIKSVSPASAAPRQGDHLKLIGTVFKRE